MAGDFWYRIEELSGLASVLCGLLFLFMAIQMGFYIHGAVEAAFVGCIGLWAVALLVASRGAGKKIVLFRIVSVVLLIGGSLLAAVLLPSLHKL